MKNIPHPLLRVALFLCVFLAWTGIIDLPLPEAVNLSIIVGGVALVFPTTWLGRMLLDADPTPGHAAWITTFTHAILMFLFGASIIRAVTTYEAWRGWLIPVPREVGWLLVIITGATAALSVLNLALRGLGAPFAIVLSRRLAVDWLYAWTRNPMVLASLAFLLSLGIWFQSAYFVLWACILVTPALLFFVKVLEERELEIRFGESYRKYRARTPMLIPRRPGVVAKGSDHQKRQQ